MPALTTKRFSRRQAYGHVLVAGEDEVDADVLEHLERVAGVVDDVALPPGARHGQQVVVEDEDAEVGGLGELLLDPRVAAAADDAVVEVGLGRVDGDDGDAVHVQRAPALAEELLEVDVADVPRVVVPGTTTTLLALDALEVRLGLRVLLLEAERRQVARADDDVRLELVDLHDRAVGEVRHEVRRAAVEIRRSARS